MAQSNVISIQKPSTPSGYVPPTKEEQAAVRALREAAVKAPAGEKEQLLAAFCKELYKHAKQMNDELLDGSLPEIAIGVDVLDKRILGFFRPGRNEFGLRFTVTMNLLHLAGQPAWHTLSTLLHEMAHGHQHLHGIPGKIKRHHHNEEYRALVAKLGIPCDEGGTDAMPPAEEGPFREYCKRHNIPWGNAKGKLGPEEKHPVLPPLPGALPPKRPQMALWTCGCTKVRASAGVELQARCGKCGHEFERR